MSNEKRNSLGQLPLPTSIVNTTATSSTVPKHLPPSSSLNSPTSTTSPFQHALPITQSNIQLHNAQYPASAANYVGHVSAFTAGGSITSPVSPARSTHAGGIQPSASFFRPSRPGDRYAPSNRFNSPALPPHMRPSPDDDTSDEDVDESLYQNSQQNQPRSPRLNNTQTLAPHPLSLSLSQSSSLSAHQHHHSNHSSELIKAHEDRGGRLSVDLGDGQQPKGVTTKLSKEPLLPISNHKGLTLSIPTPGGLQVQRSNTTTSASTPTKSKRVSIDAAYHRDSLSAPRLHLSSVSQSSNDANSRRNSGTSKGRLTFDSLRRSIDSGVGSTAIKRFSFGLGADTTVLESGSDTDSKGGRVSTTSRGGSGSKDIPLTPTKAARHGSTRKKERRSRLYRSDDDDEGGYDSGESVRSGISSAGGHFVDRLTRREEGLEGNGEEGTLTPNPTAFNPTPPPLQPGEYPLMKTPLYHPLDPSLIPESRIKVKGRRRRRRDVDLDGSKLGNEGSFARGDEEEPRARRKSKGFLTFLYPEDSTSNPLVSPFNPPQPQTQLPLFNANVNPSQSSSTLHSSNLRAKVAHRYELHPSRNSFFMRGRIITGGDDPWAFVLTLLVVLSIAGVWFGCVGRWWWEEGGLGVEAGREGLVIVNAAARRAGKAVVIICIYAACVVLSSMLVTAFSDPGILPRNVDPDPPYPEAEPIDGLKTPMPRDLKVRTEVVRVKYCPTCRTYRPPRSSHCKMCDNCVDGCDHHCQWVNNCVGRRNYTSFFVLLMSATLTLILIILTSALQLFYLTRWQALSFGQALGRTPGTAVAFCLAIIVIWPVAALLSYHLRLLLLNVTTIEQIRNQAHKTLGAGPPPPNPFSHGSWRKNFVAVLCRPQTLSWLNASGIATEDRREINPGMLMERQPSVRSVKDDFGAFGNAKNKEPIKFSVNDEDDDDGQ
ncbi:hypothetical protein FA15DRAFT_690792 [Coprinopsis marcescibilis]|uniref:Palmitoyltransferase DHHC domain-containing protein n=1 Tax=Coprinopsis marcescibilis TaxID=230819 RepID=A0A5C3LBM1_COPMA|nr:hypothetical protein FA15DRAFT_690792 [Coprinopsis marcescibilis]